MTVPADARVIVLICGAALVTAAMILLWAYYGSTGTHRRYRGPARGRYPSRPAAAPRPRTGLLEREFPRCAERPTQPFSHKDFKEAQEP